MTIDNLLAIATLLCVVCNGVWSLALAIEIRSHNQRSRAYNREVKTPTNTTPHNFSDSGQCVDNWPHGIAARARVSRKY